DNSFRAYPKKVSDPLKSRGQTPFSDWLLDWRRSLRDKTVANSSNSRQVKGPVDSVGTVVRRLVASLDYQAGAIWAIGVIPILVPIIAVWRLLDWRVALALTAGWLVLADFLLRRLGTTVARRAAWKFNRKFPEGSAWRPPALAILAGLSSQYSSL